jgi:hypothetical protein
MSEEVVLEGIHFSRGQIWKALPLNGPAQWARVTGWNERQRIVRLRYADGSLHTAKPSHFQGQRGGYAPVC